MNRIKTIVVGVGLVVLALLLVWWLWLRTPADQNQLTPQELVLIETRNLDLYQRVLEQFNPFPGIVLDQIEISDDFQKVFWSGRAAQKKRLAQYQIKIRNQFPKVLWQLDADPDQTVRFQAQSAIRPQQIMGLDKTILPSPNRLLSVSKLLDKHADDWCRVISIKAVSSHQYQVELQGSLIAFLGFLRSLQAEGFGGQLGSLFIRSHNPDEFDIHFVIESRT